MIKKMIIIFSIIIICIITAVYVYDIFHRTKYTYEKIELFFYRGDRGINLVEDYAVEFYIRDCYWCDENIFLVVGKFSDIDSIVTLIIDRDTKTIKRNFDVYDTAECNKIRKALLYSECK